jgi:hypothetical protein
MDVSVWTSVFAVRQAIECEQKPLFDAYWDETFASIHPNWRDSEMGPAIYYHA